MRVPFKTASITVESPDGLPVNDHITVTNDIKTGVMVCVSNGFLGTRSVGYVMPGHTVTLPSGGALRDVYLLRQVDGLVFLDLNGGTINYDSKKPNVHRQAHLKVSEFYVRSGSRGMRAPDVEREQPQPDPS